MKKNIEDILREQKINNSKHDNMIVKISDTISLSPDIQTMFKSAYFRQKIKNRHFEGDIDLLAMNYDSSLYDDYTHWSEVKFGDSTLLIYEIKTTDSTKNYHRALRQLKKEKEFLKTFTNYQNFECFYAFGVGTGFTWRNERVM